MNKIKDFLLKIGEITFRRLDDFLKCSQERIEELTKEYEVTLPKLREALSK